MIAMREIQIFVNRIAEEFKPRRIIMFGSYAHGNPTENSDVDILIVMPHGGHSVEKIIEIRQRVDAPFALDLLVRSPREVRRRLAMDDWFMHDIVEKGVALFDDGSADLCVPRRKARRSRAVRLTPATREWLTRAEASLASAERCFRARPPSFDHVCFHTHHAAESYLKAVLQQSGRRFGKTHDLMELIAWLNPVARSIAALEPAAMAMKDYDHKFRYPPHRADRATALHAMENARRICDAARVALNVIGTKLHRSRTLIDARSTIAAMGAFGRVVS